MYVCEEATDLRMYVHSCVSTLCRLMSTLGLNPAIGGRTFFLASNSPLTKYAQMYELLAETADTKAKYVEIH